MIQRNMKPVLAIKFLNLTNRGLTSKDFRIWIWNFVYGLTYANCG